jgi:3-phosphoshikimate 1-carboxyvinyltransferase
MGADIEILGRDDTARTADLRVRAAVLTATDVAGPEVPGLIDEIPVLAVAAAHAVGTTTFADAAELRVKESDRVATTVAALTALGAGAEERPDGLVVVGRPGRPLDGGVVDAHGDHRIAMAFAVAGLRATSENEIHVAEAAAISFPEFFTHLRTLCPS